MKTFYKRDDNFVCENCGKTIKSLGYTTRDHCPYCLYSKHVDINPGDRANSCKGLLIPISIDKYKDTYKIVYQCNKCKEIHRNVMANDDDINKIIEISKNNI